MAEVGDRGGAAEAGDGGGVHPADDDRANVECFGVSSVGNRDRIGVGSSVVGEAGSAGNNPGIRMVGDVQGDRLG